MYVPVGGRLHDSGASYSQDGHNSVLDIQDPLEQNSLCEHTLPDPGKLLATKPAVFKALLHYQALQHLKS